MTLLAAVIIGFGLGIASFGTLWLTIRQVVREPRWRVLVTTACLARLFLVGLALCVLSRHGPDQLVSGLVGLWLARCGFIWRLGGMPHGR